MRIVRGEKIVRDAAGVGRLRQGLVARGLAVAGTAAVVAGLILGSAEPASAAPFNCTSDMYFTSLNPSSLQVRAPDGTTTTLATNVPYSSIGFNPVDGFLYGIGNPPTSNVLYRIASDGTATNLGPVAGMSTNAAYSEATFDAAGHFLVPGPAGTGIYSIDVSGTTPTATIVSTAAVQGGDGVWLNGALYWMIGGSGRLNRTDLTTGTTTASPVINNPDFNPGPFGGSNLGTPATAMWAFDGHLYVGVVNNWFEILNYSGAAPSAVRVNITTGGIAGDGASCATAANPFINAVNDDYRATPLTAGSAGVVGNVFANDTMNGAAVVPSAVTAVLTDVGGATGATLGADGRISIPATVPAGDYTVTYRICEAAAPRICSDSASVIRIVAAVAAAAPASSASASAPTLAATGVDSPPLGLGLGALVLLLGGLTLLIGRRRLGRASRR